MRFLNHCLIYKLTNSFTAVGSLDLLQDTDEDKNIALHFAIENGHLQLVKLCIDRAFQNGKSKLLPFYLAYFAQNFCE